MKNQILFFLFIINQLSIGQTKVLDSLNNNLNIAANDSLKLEALYSLSKYYVHYDTEKQLDYASKGLNLSKAKKNLDFQGKFLTLLGTYYKKKGKIDSAFQNYYSAEKIFLKQADSVAYYKNKSNISNLNKAKGNYEAAVRDFQLVISYFEKKDDKKSQLTAIKCKGNLGILYAYMNEYNKAIDVFKDIEKNPIIKNNSNFLGVVYVNLTGAYIKLKQLDSALYYAEKAEKVIVRKRSLANLYNNIGAIHKDRKNYSKAEFYFKKSLKLYEKLKSDSGIAKSYNNLGDIYLLLNKYQLAENYLLKANKLLEKDANIISLEQNYKTMTNLYVKKKNYEKALNYKQLQFVLKDSILGIETKKSIKDFEIKYDTEKVKRQKEKAEQQVIISQLETKRTKSLFIAFIVISALLLISLLFYLGRIKAKKRAELITIELKETQKRLAIEKQYRDSELKALKAQMNPHFIFNALNSIQDYIVLNQKNLASDYLGKFADLIRNYLHYSDTGFISIQDEVHNLNLYLELEKLRFEDVLEYTFNISEDANSDAINIPTMLIQPYIENALKHGLLHKKDNRKLNISISKISDKIIECVIEDNGIGRKKSKEINRKRESEHKSFALKATTERLDLLNYSREKKIGVTFIDLKDNNEKATGTKVILKIPILKK